MSSDEDSPSLFQIWKALQVRQSLSGCAGLGGFAAQVYLCLSAAKTCLENWISCFQGPARLSSARARRAKSLSQTSLIFSLQFSEIQQIVWHLHDHTLQIHLIGWSDCSTTSLLTFKMYSILNPTLACLTIKGSSSQFLTLLHALLLYHKVKFQECMNVCMNLILKDEMKKNTQKCPDPDPMHCFQMLARYV